LRHPHARPLRKHRGRLQTESLTIVQRFGSSLTLNVHFHAIVMDGVYAEQPDGSLLFHPLSAPSDEDIARLARAMQMRFDEERMAHCPDYAPAFAMQPNLHHPTPRQKTIFVQRIRS